MQPVWVFPSRRPLSSFSSGGTQYLGAEVHVSVLVASACQPLSRSARVLRFPRSLWPLGRVCMEGLVLKPPFFYACMAILDTFIFSSWTEKKPK